MWLVYLAALMSAAAPLHAQECGKGLLWNPCASPCEPTCDDPAPVCLKDRCAGRCVCPEDRPILHGGQCLTANGCNHVGCPAGMVMKSCGPPPACRKTCEAPDPVCIQACVEGCVCPDHAPYERDGQCYTEEGCRSNPGPAPECSVSGMVHSVQAPLCAPTCLKPGRCERGPHPGCHCPDHAPLLHNRRCIAESECPTPPSVCQPGMVWSTCAPGPDCQRVCGSLTATDRCAGTPCRPGCGCPPDRPIYDTRREQCVVDRAGCLIGTSAATHFTSGMALMLSLLLQHF